MFCLELASEFYTSKLVILAHIEERPKQVTWILRVQVGLEEFEFSLTKVC
jgi:hypothetical protein